MFYILAMKDLGKIKNSFDAVASVPQGAASRFPSLYMDEIIMELLKIAIPTAREQYLCTHHS
jgi:hypothetical protein